MTNEEIIEKITELEDENKKKDEEISELTEKVEKNTQLAKNHEHKGEETKRLEDLIKRLSYVDVKELRIAGATGYSGTLTVVKSIDFGESTYTTCTITVVDGFITASTC